MKVAAGVPVRNAAARLQVTPSRVRALIRADLLQAEKIGDRWLVDASSLDRRSAAKAPVGRALKSTNAWAALLLASGANGRAASWLKQLSPWALSRIRSRLRKEGLRIMAPRLRGRAILHRFRAHPSDLAGIVQEPGVVRGGVSAAADYHIDISDPGTIEAYVSEKRLPKLKKKYFLEPSSSPNVILHAISGSWPFPPSSKVVPVAVAAFDLLEAEDERSRRAGEELLRHLERE